MTDSMAQTSADAPSPSTTAGDFALSQPAGLSDTSAPTAAFQDQFHGYMQGKFGSGSADTGKSDSVLIASSDSGAGSAIGSVMNYAGYITYIGLAASAFGHDDPFNLQTKATRFFQEKVLHHHAIDNPQTWVAMGDALMTEQHLASQGAKFKPVSLGSLKTEEKHESAEEKRQGKAVEHDAKDADGIISDITKGLRTPDDYVLAAKFMYSEAVNKASERGTKEATDHKDEKRVLGRFKLLKGETDRTDALGTRDNNIDPLLDELGARVSYRLDEADFLDQYGGKVPELGWTKEASDLREAAKKVFYDPNDLSLPVKRRLHEQYPEILPWKQADPPGPATDIVVR